MAQSEEEKKNKETLENYDDILDVIMQLAYIKYTHMIDSLWAMKSGLNHLIKYQ